MLLARLLHDTDLHQLFSGDMTANEHGRRLRWFWGDAWLRGAQKSSGAEWTCASLTTRLRPLCLAW